MQDESSSQSLGSPWARSLSEDASRSPLFLSLAPSASSHSHRSPSSSHSLPQLSDCSSIASSNNPLNLGFIDDSLSEISEDPSISSVGEKRYPHVLELEGLSDLEEWSEESSGRQRRNWKRMRPSMEEENEEEAVCTKRKMIEKMKVVTLNPMARKQAVALAHATPLRKLPPNLPPTPTLFPNSDDQELFDLLKELHPQKENAPRKSQ